MIDNMRSSERYVRLKRTVVRLLDTASRAVGFRGTWKTLKTRQELSHAEGLFEDMGFLFLGLSTGTTWATRAHVRRAKSCACRSSCMRDAERQRLCLF
jgi:hypothetical protein